MWKFLLSEICTLNIFQFYLISTNENIFHQYFACSLSKMSLPCESKTCYQHNICKVFLVSLFSWSGKRVWVLLLPLLVETLNSVFSLVNFYFFRHHLVFIYILIMVNYSNFQLMFLLSHRDLFFHIYCFFF